MPKRRSNASICWIIGPSTRLRSGLSASSGRGGLGPQDRGHRADDAAGHRARAAHVVPVLGGAELVAAAPGDRPSRRRTGGRRCRSCGTWRPARRAPRRAERVGRDLRPVRVRGRPRDDDGLGRAGGARGEQEHRRVVQLGAERLGTGPGVPWRRAASSDDVATPPGGRRPGLAVDHDEVLEHRARVDAARSGRAGAASTTTARTSESCSTCSRVRPISAAFIGTATIPAAVTASQARAQSKVSATKIPTGVPTSRPSEASPAANRSHHPTDSR